MAIYFFPSVWGRLFCDTVPHANLQIIESRGNNSRRLFCPLTTQVSTADAVILLKSTLAVAQMRQREKTPSGKHPRGSSLRISGQPGSCGRFLAKTIVILHQVQSACYSVSALLHEYVVTIQWDKYSAFYIFIYIFIYQKILMAGYRNDLLYSVLNPPYLSLQQSADLSTFVLSNRKSPTCVRESAGK